MRSLAVVAIAAAVGAIAYVTGEAAADPPLHWSRGFGSGYRAGVRAADARATAREQRLLRAYRPGGAGWRAIFAAGRRQGYTEGQAEARATAPAAPPAPPGLAPGRWYVVRIDPGPRGGPPRLGPGVPIAPHVVYGACAQDPRRLCDEPVRGG